MWVEDGFVVGLALGCKGKEKGRRENTLFSGVYTVYGIGSLFQEHSPGVATGSVPRADWDEIIVGVGWGLRERTLFGLARMYR